MSPVLLKCYLRRQGDDRHVILLFTHALVVVFGGERIDFQYQQIKGLNITRKKLIIPLVLGGIGTSLGWLALSQEWYHYQTNLFLVFLFFGWMYYGFWGKDALELSEGTTHHVFLLQANHRMVHAFLSFVKERLFQRLSTPESMVYHLTTKENWESQEQSIYYEHSSLQSEGFIHASYLAELKSSYDRYFAPSDELILLGIDLKKVEAEVNIVHVSSRSAYFPHIHGDLNKSAIVLLHTINSSEDISSEMIIL